MDFVYRGRTASDSWKNRQRTWTYSTTGTYDDQVPCRNTLSFLPICSHLFTFILIHSNFFELHIHFFILSIYSNLFSPPSIYFHILTLTSFHSSFLVFPFLLEYCLAIAPFHGSHESSTHLFTALLLWRAYATAGQLSLVIRRWCQIRNAFRYDLYGLVPLICNWVRLLFIVRDITSGHNSIWWCSTGSCCMMSNVLV